LSGNWNPAAGTVGLKEHQLDVVYAKGGHINLVPREIVEEEAALLPWPFFFKYFENRATSSSKISRVHQPLALL
jgi:hypothetical protein